MKKMLFLASLLLIGTLLHAQNKTSISPTLLESITADELSAQLHFIASDFFAGRKAATKDELAAAHYLASCYKSMGIPPLQGKPNADLEAYFQNFTFSRSGKNLNSQNVIAYLEGDDPKLKEEILIIVAHYDHLGVDSTITGDSIFNGAADDGSGTVALIELAETFNEARKQGLTINRSILFLHTGAEEAGIHGSTIFVRNPPVPLEKISAVINMDGVGGTDKPSAQNASNYVYLLQNDSISLPLARLTQELNTSNKINLDLLTPANPERFNSDNKPFEYELIPSIYFSSGLTEHYHKVSDEPATIDYQHMAKIVRLIFSLTWQLSNDSMEKAALTRSQFTKTGSFFCRPCGCASDNKEFKAIGSCPDCAMPLHPKWQRIDKQ